jgi:NitT/TauT family transport system permease protein
MATATVDHAAELSGLDALELAVPSRPSAASRVWAALWPKLLAFVLFVGTWQIVVWTGWKDEFVLPAPATVAKTLVEDRAELWEAVVQTMSLAVRGFALALLIGGLVGLAVARSRVLRAAIGSMITGLQTMPSIAWAPLAILLFQLNESAIFFVVVLGAAPSIANGLIQGIDHVPPILLRAGRVLGARGLTAVRYVALPAALPSFVGGLKQGWAFSWRSLMAGELLVLIPGAISLGQRLNNERQLADADGVLAVMIVIFAIGVIVDGLVFAKLDLAIRKRYGLIDTGA